MNNEAVLRLFDTYADDAFHLAYSYLGSRPDAEDVVQDVFVKLIRSDITITKGKEKSYILTMTANKCRDFLKSADVVFKAPFEDADDAQTRELEARENRVIPTDDVDESVRAEIEAAVSSQDKAEDEYFETVNVNADYYSDPDLNEYANYYAQQNYYIMDIGKDAEHIDGYNDLRTNDWYSEGFFVCYTTGDNASPTFARILVFKATPEQLEGFMKNNFAIVNYEREGHGQNKVAYEDFWTESTDSEGNAVYEASWTGPEPEMKLEPSDSARFMNFTLTYDAAKQLVVCTINEGGGIG